MLEGGITLFKSDQSARRIGLPAGEAELWCSAADSTHCSVTTAGCGPRLQHSALHQNCSTEKENTNSDLVFTWLIVCRVVISGRHGLDL